MNIKDAKNQIKNAVSAYLTKDELGDMLFLRTSRDPSF